MNKAMLGAIKIGASIGMLLTIFLFSILYILPGLATVTPGSTVFGQGLQVNTTNTTDDFFTNGNLVVLVANFTCSVNADCTNSTGRTAYANFTNVGGSSEVAGVLKDSGVSYAVYEFAASVGSSYSIINFQSANITANFTANDTSSVTVWTMPVLVNMSTIPGCPPAGDPLPPAVPLLNGTEVSITGGCWTNCTGNDRAEANSTGDYHLCGPTFGADSTNFTQIAESGNFSNIPLVIDIPGKAKINFTSGVNMSTQQQASAIMQFAVKNLMTAGRIGVNDTEWGGSDPTKPNLNLTARLTLYNISGLLGITTGFPQIIRVAHGADLSAGSTCSPNICSNIVWDGQNLTLTVSSFSDYGASDDINVTLASPTNFSYTNTRNVNFTFTPIWNTSDMKNCTVYGNLTGSGWVANASNTTPLVNGTINGINNTVNADGPYLWNVYCFDTGTGYDYDSTNFTVTVDTTAPTISITSPTATTYSSSSITFTYTASDAGSGISSCSYTLDGGSATSAGSSVSTTFNLGDGSHTISVTCTNGAGTSATQSVTFSVGAGGTSSPSVSSVDGTSKITFPSIAAGANKTITITKGEHGVREIEISVKNKVTSVYVNVGKLPGKPATVVHEVTGKIYHYMEINKTNIENEDIDKIKIKFVVNKSWITKNNIDESTITLNRYTTQWDKLTTTKVSETDEEITFEAESPGLSYFAISGEVPEEICIENWSCSDWSECIEGKQTRECTDANVCGTTVNKPAEEQACEVPEEKPVDYTLIIILGILIILAAGIWLYFQGLSKKK